MKKVLGIIALVIVLGATLASCMPHKQACAAYSDVEIEQEAQ